MPLGAEKAALMGAAAGGEKNYWGDESLGDCQFGASGITQSGDSTAIDTVLTTGSEAGGPGSSSYGTTVPNDTACYETTVLSTSGSYDGDMWVGNFTNLTVDADVTLTTDRPCRGMFIYCSGDCTINGALSMTARGGLANPTTSGGSDSNAVGSGGLQIGLFTSGGSQSFTNDGTGFNGAGTTVRTAVANQDDIASNGDILTISQTGGGGGAVSSQPAGGNQGKTGGQAQAGATGATTISTGGGGGGATTFGGCPNNQGGNTTAGGDGGAFSGGAGGGGGSGYLTCPFTANGTGAQYGGAGGAGTRGGTHSDFYAAGGAGNAGGAGTGSYSQTGQSGIGGVIWLLVKGDLTIGAAGTVEAKGQVGGNANSPPNSAGGAGAGSGGGAIMIAYAGTATNNGSITAAGGGRGSGRQGPQNPLTPGDSGTGGVHTIQVEE